MKKREEGKVSGLLYFFSVRTDDSPWLGRSKLLDQSSYALKSFSKYSKHTLLVGRFCIGRTSDGILSSNEALEKKREAEHAKADARLLENSSHKECHEGVF
jgi:hypothetical protein